jgi:hypothetical protein
MGAESHADQPRRARFWNYRRAGQAEAVLFALVEGHKKNATLRAKNDALTEYQKDVYEAALDVLGLPSDYLDLGRPASDETQARPCGQPACDRTTPCEAGRSGWCAHPDAEDGLAAPRDEQARS